MSKREKQMITRATLTKIKSDSGENEREKENVCSLVTLQLCTLIIALLLLLSLSLSSLCWSVLSLATHTDTYADTPIHHRCTSLWSNDWFCSDRICPLEFESEEDIVHLMSNKRLFFVIFRYQNQSTGTVRMLRFSFQRFCNSVVYLTKTIVAGRLKTMIPIKAHRTAAKRASN